MSMKQSKVVKKRKKSALPSKTIMKRNIRELWNEIPWDFYYKEKDWYWDCHKWCQSLADEKKLDLMCVVACFSALSPQCSYKQNKLFCRAYFEGISKHTKTQIGKCDLISAMYGIDSHDNRKEYIRTVLGGEKTKDFFSAILEPWNTETVVIDRHMLVIAGITKPTVTAKQYQAIKECYLEIAEENNISGNELQSGLWVWKRQQKHGYSKYD